MIRILKPDNNRLKKQIISCNIGSDIFIILGMMFYFVSSFFISIFGLVMARIGILLFLTGIWQTINQKQDKIRLEIRDIPNQIILEVQGKCMKKK